MVSSTSSDYLPIIPYMASLSASLSRQKYTENIQSFGVNITFISSVEVKHVYFTS